MEKFSENFVGFEGEKSTVNKFYSSILLCVVFFCTAPQLADLPTLDRPIECPLTEKLGGLVALGVCQQIEILYENFRFKHSIQHTRNSRKNFPHLKQ